MSSKIRPATIKEVEKAERIRDRSSFSKSILYIIDEAECKGLRVVYHSRNKQYAKILFPSGGLLCWDFNPRSLDPLHYENNHELESACLYAGFVAQSIFRI